MTWARPRSRSHRLPVRTAPSVGLRPSSSPVIRACPLAAGEGGTGPAVGARGFWKACNRECRSRCRGDGTPLPSYGLAEPRHGWANCDLEEAAQGRGGPSVLPAPPPSARRPQILVHEALLSQERSLPAANVQCELSPLSREPCAFASPAFSGTPAPSSRRLLSEPPQAPPARLGSLGIY